jgi:hypothetical protein
MAARRPLLLEALNDLYGRSEGGADAIAVRPSAARQDGSATDRVPWMNAPEDSWL